MGRSLRVGMVLVPSQLLEQHETWALTMRWHDPATGEDIPDYDGARAEVEAGRAELQAERTRADAERGRADAERARADAAQRMVEELRKRLPAGNADVPPASGP